MIFFGIDIGSNTAKGALLKDNQIIASSVVPAGFRHDETARKVLQNLLDDTRLQFEQVTRVVSTGYGRKSVSFSHKAVTEIICHAAGAALLHPGLGGIVDVGGQDSKAIRLGEDGQVTDFAMNDKCAAGTGRFLEVMAGTLGLGLDQMGPRGLQSENPVKISAICTVFAESEVISMIAAQKERADIIAGIHESAAQRIAGLAKKAKLTAPLMMTGGVALNPGLVHALEQALGQTLLVHPLCQKMGAVGAAVLASRL